MFFSFAGKCGTLPVDYKMTTKCNPARKIIPKSKKDLFNKKNGLTVTGVNSFLLERDGV